MTYKLEGAGFQAVRWKVLRSFDQFSLCGSRPPARKAKRNVPEEVPEEAAEEDEDGGFGDAEVEPEAIDGIPCDSNGEEVGVQDDDQGVGSGHAPNDGGSDSDDTIRLEDAREDSDADPNGLGEPEDPQSVSDGSDYSSYDDEPQTPCDAGNSYTWREELFTTPDFGNSGPPPFEITEMCIGLMRFFQRTFPDIAEILRCFL